MPQEIGKMGEVEAKFRIPDRETFERLCGLKELAGFLLERTGVKRIRDCYLDTADRAILRAGYACRLRSKDAGAIAEGRGMYLATVKGLGGADPSSGIHQREELEEWVDGPDPLDWPASAVRDRVIRLCEGKPLQQLFALNQERHLRLLYPAAHRENGPLGELSLDLVTLAKEGSSVYYELEIELLNEDGIGELKQITGRLRSSWGLAPETRSKFERGLASDPTRK
jgi:inorganic triphosphatase YgiF